jgi:GTP-binding protein
VSVEEVSDDRPVISLSSEAALTAWTVEKIDDVYVVRGDKIEKFTRRTNFDQYEGVNRLRDIMKKMGITHELARQGAVGNSVIRIGIDEFTLLEQQND